MESTKDFVGERRDGNIVNAVHRLELLNETLSK